MKASKHLKDPTQRISLRKLLSFQWMPLFLGIDQDISESMASQEEITLTNESKDLVDDKDDATEFRMDTTFLDIEENND